MNIAALFLAALTSLPRTVRYVCAVLLCKRLALSKNLPDLQPQTTCCIQTTCFALARSGPPWCCQLLLRCMESLCVSCCLNHGCNCARFEGCRFLLVRSHRAMWQQGECGPFGSRSCASGGCLSPKLEQKPPSFALAFCRKSCLRSLHFQAQASRKAAVAQRSAAVSYSSCGPGSQSSQQPVQIPDWTRLGSTRNICYAFGLNRSPHCALLRWHQARQCSDGCELRALVQDMERGYLEIWKRFCFMPQHLVSRHVPCVRSTPRRGTVRSPDATSR